MPPATNTIAGVITDPRSRRDTAAYARTRSAIATRPEPPNLHSPPGKYVDRQLRRTNNENTGISLVTTITSAALGAVYFVDHRRRRRAKTAEPASQAAHTACKAGWRFEG
jgi:hypothetical protein